MAVSRKVVDPRIDIGQNRGAGVGITWLFALFVIGSIGDRVGIEHVGQKLATRFGLDLCIQFIVNILLAVVSTNMWQIMWPLDSQAGLAAAFEHGQFLELWRLNLWLS